MSFITKNQDPGLFGYQPYSVSGMGTKLEPTIHFLATSSPSSNNRFTILHRSVNDWEYLQDSSTNNKLTKAYTFAMTTTGLDNKFHHQALNKMLHKGDIDSIRNTMQIHEDIFKTQVKELHRLYSVQKMLMEEQRNETKNKQNTFWGTTHLQNSTSGGLILNLQSMRDERNSRERSGSCSGDNMRIISRGLFDLERPATAEEDISTGVSTVDEDHQAGPSKINIEEVDEDSEIELTLSIGGSLSKSKTKRSKSSVLFKSERADQDCSDPTTPMSSSSATFDQETKRPHWLFQSLKLK